MIWVSVARTLESGTPDSQCDDFIGSKSDGLTVVKTVFRDTGLNSSLKIQVRQMRGPEEIRLLKAMTTIK